MRRTGSDPPRRVSVAAETLTSVPADEVTKDAKTPRPAPVHAAGDPVAPHTRRPTRIDPALASERRQAVLHERREFCAHPSSERQRETLFRGFDHRGGKWPR